MPIASAKFRLDLRVSPAPTLDIEISLQSPTGQQNQVRQRIALTSTVQNFGGRRWWMACPLTGSRARKLYLAPNATCFASRRALQLGYRVERLSHFDRPFEKLFRAQRKLGCGQGLGANLSRPKGMWRRTFAKHIEAIESLDANCISALASLVPHDF
jgi:hypothetical protein